MLWRKQGQLDAEVATMICMYCVTCCEHHALRLLAVCPRHACVANDCVPTAATM